MNKVFLTAVSAIALMGASSAMADNQGSSKHVAEPGSAAAYEQSTGNFSEDVKNAWKDIKHDTTEAYEDIKATVVNATKQDDKSVEKDDFKIVLIDERMTATGMIGKSIYSTEGERVGTLKDIILDKNGKAMMAIVADGEFIGLGKKAAFDYNVVARINEDGDFIMPLTEQAIDTAAEFSYDQKENSNGVRVMPNGGYSVATLLDSQLVDQNKKVIAEVDNITFMDGHADRLIAGFDKILGMGGEKAVLSFDSTEIIKDKDGYDFQLNATHTAQFKSYKNTVIN